MSGIYILSLKQACHYCDFHFDFDEEEKGNGFGFTKNQTKKKEFQNDNNRDYLFDFGIDFRRN
jgi:hypothetical protein